MGQRSSERGWLVFGKARNTPTNPLMFTPYPGASIPGILRRRIPRNARIYLELHAIISDTRG